MESSQQFIQIDPAGVRIIISEIKFDFLSRHGQAFNQAESAIQSREASAPIIEPPRDQFERKAGAGLNMLAKQSRIEICAECVNIVKQQILQLGPFGQQTSQHSIQKQIGYFIPVSNRVQTLEGKIVRVIARLT